MSGMGVAMMGTGIAEGESRAMLAAQKAVSSPLLEDGSVHGARGVIINVTGGSDMSLMEVNEASCVIQEAAHEDANIIFGAVVDPQLKGTIKITVIATGFDKVHKTRSVPAAALQTPTDLSNYTAHLVAASASGASADPAFFEPAASQQAQMASSQAASSQMTSPQMATSFAPSLTVSRRAPIDLSLPLAMAGGGSGSSGELSLSLDSPLDVPAFLRRQS
jgi:cell division GTPase FtsZ